MFLKMDIEYSVLEKSSSSLKTKYCICECFSLCKLYWTFMTSMLATKVYHLQFMQGVMANVQVCWISSRKNQWTLIEFICSGSSGSCLFFRGFITSHMVRNIPSCHVWFHKSTARSVWMGDGTAEWTRSLCALTDYSGERRQPCLSPQYLFLHHDLSPDSIRTVKDISSTQAVCFFSALFECIPLWNTYRKTKPHFFCGRSSWTLSVYFKEQPCLSVLTRCPVCEGWLIFEYPCAVLCSVMSSHHTHTTSHRH